MEWEFEGTAIEWRGPAPFVFVPVQEEIAVQIQGVAPMVTYGWGVIPATVMIGETEFTTSLFPKNGGYLIPVKVVVQRAEGVTVGDVVGVTLTLDVNPL